MKKKIFAFVGMPGSGKNEAIKCLQEKYSAPMLYFGTITFELLEKENLPLNYKNEHQMREKLRKEFGMEAYAILNLPKINDLLKKNKVVLIDGLATWSEFKLLQKEYGDSFKIVAVCASPETRFKRLAKKKRASIKDWTDFQKRDYTEIEMAEKGGPIAIADYTIVNEGSLKELCKKTEEIV